MRWHTGAKLFRKAYAYSRLWLSNGRSYLEDFKYPLFLATAIKVYIPSATLITIVLIVIASMLIIFTIGFVDYKYIHVAQTQAEIATSKYNPYFRKLKLKLSSKA